jgi:cbb3-type cytochrome oxidase maturation protein
MIGPVPTLLAISLEWMLFVIAALVGLGAWFVYLWALRDGQFKDIEEPAERLLSQDLRD